MAYGRIYIENLRNKVTVLFDELKKNNRLCEDNFIEAFKRKYPKDYAMLQYEWDFKVHEFKKNRKGYPKPHPIGPEKILSNMYRNYYFKLVKNPAIKKSKQRSVDLIRSKAGRYGYKIKKNACGRFDVINKENKEIEYGNLTYAELFKRFSPQGICEIKVKQKERIKKSAMKTGSKVKILNKDSEHYGKIGTLEQQNVECMPICSVYFNDGDFDFFLEDEIEEVG